MTSSLDTRSVDIVANLNLRGDWDINWTLFASDSKVTIILGIFGTLVVIVAAVMFIWARRRGDGQKGRTAMLVDAMFVGAL